MFHLQQSMTAIAFKPKWSWAADNDTYELIEPKSSKMPCKNLSKTT